MPRIAMSAPDLDRRDIAAVVRVLRSGRLALGPRAEEFERRVAEHVGVRHGVAVSSGTAALQLILRGLGIGAGDEVIVPSFTFVAAVNAVFHVGARPVFADIDPTDLCLDPADAERRVGPRTRAVLAVDTFGHPADWGRLEELGRRLGLALVDDACEALGSVWQGRRIGSLGHAAAFGFYPNKQITTGEGGMIVTDDDDLAALARSLRNQGRADTGLWLEHERLGYNYRLDEMSAALGCTQMERLESLLARRDDVAGTYDLALGALDGLAVPTPRDGVRVSRFVYVVTLARGIDRDEFMRRLARREIPSRAYFPAVHRQPWVVERLGVSPGILPITEDMARRTVALPFHGALTGDDVDEVAAACREALL